MYTPIKLKALKLLAIDQSLTESGICLYETKINTFKTWTIKPKKLKGIERLNYIEKEVEDVLEKHKIDYAIMEGYSYGSIGRTFELGELGGMLKRLFNRFDIPLIIVPPTKWKKAVVGKGNYNKDRIILEVIKKYGYKFTNNNECDAWCLARFLMESGYID